MQSVKNDFADRMSEINVYFQFAKIVDNDSNTIITNYGNVYNISDKLQKILLANGFLILYNLVESTIRNSIKEIFYQMTFNNLSYKTSIDKVKSLWLDHELQPLKEGTFRIDTLKGKIESIVNGVLNEEILNLIEENEDFSGNLDAQKIRQWAGRFGIQIPNKPGDNLLTIKNKRNQLAHGNSTFSNIGKDFTIGELIDFKEEAYEFLSDVLIKVEDFLDNRRYELTVVL
jgi:hypothetical protein